MAKVSVITACHNAEPFIARSITSVLKQTWKDWELIVVDDGSTDASLDQIERLAGREPRVRVHAFSDNRGPGAARNKAIELSDGEWLAILDADDAFLENKLEMQMQYVSDRGRAVVLVGTNSYDVDEEGVRIGSNRYPAESRRLKSNLVRMRRFPPHSSLTYRAETVKGVGGFNNRFLRSQDYDICLRLAGEGAFGLVEEPLVEYRRHAAGISGSKGAGYGQAVYGTAANVCHHLRERGYEDPSQGKDGAEWTTFLSMVEEELVDVGVEEWNRRKGEWGRVVRGTSRLARAMRGLLAAAQSPGLLVRGLKQAMTGDRQRVRFAVEWGEKRRVP